MKLSVNNFLSKRVSSLPVRECGLKFLPLSLFRENHIVTPGAGVWIEICINLCNVLEFFVTPGAGVWIEMSISSDSPSNDTVTPGAGVWIEIRR